MYEQALGKIKQSHASMVMYACRHLSARGKDPSNVNRKMIPNVEISALMFSQGCGNKHANRLKACTCTPGGRLSQLALLRPWASQVDVLQVQCCEIALTAAAACSLCCDPAFLAVSIATPAGNIRPLYRDHLVLLFCRHL